MKGVYDLEVYKLAEELSDMVWQDFDRWNKKVQTRLPTLGTGGQDTVGYQIMRSSTVQKHEGQISNFYFLISPFRERLPFPYAAFLRNI
jgi:hypothetical protein